jgi:hypothetical protein
MIHVRRFVFTALVLSVVGILPQRAEAALNANLSRRLAPIDAQAGQIKLFIATEELSGVPTGRRDGVIAVSHEAVNEIVSPRDPASAKLVQLRNPKIYQAVLSRDELTKAGLSEAALSRGRPAVITFGAPAASNPDLISLSIDLR